MELDNILKKIPVFVKKYKYVVLALLLGLVLLVFPKVSTKDTEEKITFSNETVQSVPIDEQLRTILKKIKGVGDVAVLIVPATGDEIIYQTNDKIYISESGNTTEKGTVIITDEERSQEALIKQVNPPKYMGAIIVCEGAESASVRLAIIDAVSKVTGLGSDRITVVKME